MTIPHGRYSKYSNDGCRCAACKKSWAAYVADLRVRRSYHGEAGGFVVPHGTTTGYQQYVCRCDECREASAVAGRSRTARKRAAA